MSSEAAKLEYNSLSSTQEKYYRSKYDDEDDIVESNYGVRLGKTCWISSALESSEIDEKMSKYVFNNKLYEFVEYTTISGMLPAIMVIPRYTEKVKISWGHSTPINIFKSITLQSPETTCQNVTPEKYDIFMNDMSRDMKCGKDGRTELDRQLGNIESLEEWNVALHEHKFCIPLPFFYNSGISDRNCLPLIKSPDEEIYHSFVMDLDIKNHLHMCVFDEESGDWIKLKDVNMNYLYVADGRKTIDRPVIDVKYGKAYPPNERNLDEVKSSEYNGFSCLDKYSICYQDIILASEPKECMMGSNVKFDLKSEYPVRSLIVIAAHKKGRQEDRYYSNYTTNPENIYCGNSPIDSIEYGYEDIGKPHIKISANTLHVATNINNGRRKFPTDRSYVRLCYEKFIDNLNPDIAVNISTLRPSIVIYLQDKDIKKSISDLYEEYDRKCKSESGVIIHDMGRSNSDVYIVYVYAVVNKSLNFSRDGHDGKSKIYVTV